MEDEQTLERPAETLRERIGGLDRSTGSTATTRLPTRKKFGAMSVHSSAGRETSSRHGRGIESLAVCRLAIRG